MAYMRFLGAAGQLLYNGIRESLGLLRNALSVRGMRGEDRRDAELQLITFLANAAHGGDADVRERKGESRYEFWRKLSRNNGDMFRLKLSEEPLQVDVEIEGGVLSLGLGYAEGYTMVIPFTPEGFDDYFRLGISGFDLGRRHIVPEDQRPGPNTPCYVRIGAIIHFASLANGEEYAGEVEAFHTPNAQGLMARLYQHVGDYLPPLYNDDRGRVWAINRRTPPHPLPTLLCATDGRPAGALLRKTGFRRAGQSRSGRRRYLLKVEDANKSTVRRERRSRILQQVKRINRIQQRNWNPRGRAAGGGAIEPIEPKMRMTEGGCGEQGSG